MKREHTGAEEEIVGAEDAEQLRYFLKRVSSELHDARRQLREATEAAREPIAVVGMGCRFPGGVQSPRDLWDLVAQGRDAIGEFPADRSWDLESLFAADSDTYGEEETGAEDADGGGSEGGRGGKPGTSATRHGGFLYDAGDFDAAFFNIAPREALAMDPQQRLLLETAWEAVEDAGIDPATLVGTRAGVFAGLSPNRYGAHGDAELEGHLLTGTIPAVASGRIAYTLGLHGPALTVDTACSSSLVAVHLACQAIRNDECDLALAGGAAVMATPEIFLEFSRQGGLAADGRCKAFGAGADGTGWAEGAGIIVLQRLSDAQAQGRTVLAVIAGSAVNQDGASNGLTAPNGPAQERVIQQALTNARLTADQIDAVEAHGTGTTLGDPIEAHALLNTYGQHHTAQQPLYLGSLKSNIGHTQAAAGIGGIIKMVQALQHGQLPPTLHADNPSPHIDWTTGHISLLTKTTPWPEQDRPRNAAVSSFGVSGTNAHLILQQAPATAFPERGSEPGMPEAGSGSGMPRQRSSPGALRPAPPEAPQQTLPAAVALSLSAKSAPALRAQAARLRDHVADHADLSLSETGHALVMRRGVFAHRAVVVVESRTEAIDALDALAADRPHQALVHGVADSTAERKTVFVFPGQGSQYPGMAQGLLAASPVFRDSVHATAEALGPYTDWSLLDVLRQHPGAPDLDRVDVVQPALFAVMVGLAHHWRSSGITPDAVIGHSQGEIAAAHVAGALTLDDAARIVALRSRALTTLEGRGGMASVPLPTGQAEQLLAPWSDRLTVAAVNGPAHTVVSGDATALDAFLAHCAAYTSHARRINVTYASHSHHVEDLRDDLLRVLDGITPQPAHTPFHSTLTTEPLDTRELTPVYWFDNLRHTVRFQPTLHTLLDSHHATYVEVSPHPVLTPAVQDTVDHHPSPHACLTTGTLHRKHDDRRALLTAQAQLHTHGHALTAGPLSKAEQSPSGGAPKLPTYAFQRSSYWLAPPKTAAVRESAPVLLPLTWELHATPVAGPALPERTALLTDPFGAGESLADGHPLRALVPTTRHHRTPADLSRAVESGTASAPDVVFCPLPAPAPSTTARGTVEDTRDTLARTLAFLQAWLRDERTATTRLVLLTQGAVTVTPDEDPHLAHAAATALIRTAQTEHPHRITLIDHDTPSTATDLSTALPRALALADTEPQLAIRQSEVHFPRLTRLSAAAPGASATSSWPRSRNPSWNPEGTVLITGGTGTLAAHTARHLVARHGVRHLLLASRSGPDAPGAAQLVDDLRDLGAAATIAACDVADPEAVARLVRSVPDAHPLSAVIHTAGLIDMAPLSEMAPEQLHTVLRPKADAAWHLHEATRHLDLDAFVLYSSLATTLASPGQANYAAANAYLDALAHHRHHLGLPATSIAWGPWADTNGMIRHLNTTTRNHTTRTGFPPLTTTNALHLLDTALTTPHHPTTTATHLNTTTLTNHPTLPTLLRKLAPAPASATRQHSGPTPLADTTSLRDRLAGLDTDERAARLLTVVRTAIAAVLAHPDPELIDAQQSFKELGFDSLTTVQLRNHLGHITGLRLPATLAFDHPTPQALVTHLDQQFTPETDRRVTGENLLSEIGKLESAFLSLSVSDMRHAEISARLKELLWSWENSRGDGPGGIAPEDEEIESASDEELFSVLDNELNTP
ncbi:SDR family NAD(P)-dependent oxidoreductase [Streptomyces sp. NPDC018584]|uniref:type I polyketide synthase n=1 Tax=unclassified Streptomyces TaxID=2593676 RepID=UPI003796AD86